MRNKKILITGATKGLGLECIKQFYKYNKILAIGRDDKYIKRYKSKINFIKGNLLDEKFRKELYAKLSKEKKIDIVIHCLGGGLGLREPLLDLTNFKKLFDVNLGIGADINRIIVKNLNKKSSYIVHVGSTASVEAIGSVGYNSIKTAIVSYVKSLASELIHKNIFVSSVLPGAFISQGNAFERLKKKDKEVYLDFIKNRLPRKRVSEASEIIPLIKLLTSKDGEMMAGTSVTIDACETKAYNY